MRLKVALLALALTIGMVAATGAVMFPTQASAEPKKPDCVGC
jgi:hypothetical protein